MSGFWSFDDVALRALQRPRPRHLKPQEVLCTTCGARPDAQCIELEADKGSPLVAAGPGWWHNQRAVDAEAVETALEALAS